MSWNLLMLQYNQTTPNFLFQVLVSPPVSLTMHAHCIPKNGVVQQHNAAVNNQLQVSIHEKSYRTNLLYT